MSQVRFNLVSVLRVISFVLLKSNTVGGQDSFIPTSVYAKRHAKLEKVYEINSLSRFSRIVRIDSVHYKLQQIEFVTRVLDNKTTVPMVKRQNGRSQSVLKLLHKDHNGKNLKIRCNLPSQYYTEYSSVQFLQNQTCFG